MTPELMPGSVHASVFARPNAWSRLRGTMGYGLLVTGVAIVAVIALFVFFPSMFGLSDPNAVDFEALSQPPSLRHLLGTDSLGRDMLTRVAYGGQIDLALGVGVTVASLLIGMMIGTFAGYYRGIGTTFIMRLIDVLLGFPFMVLVLCIVAIVGSGMPGVITGMMIVSWTIYARITASEMMVLRERQFILAATTMGFSDRRVMFRHAMPNLFRPNIAFAMGDVIGNIVVLASLSYLGVGVQPPAPEWGSMVASGQQYLLTAWWLSTFPGLIIVVMGVGLSFIGEWVSVQVGARGRNG